MDDCPEIETMEPYYNCSKCPSLIEIINIDENNIEFKCCNKKEPHHLTMKIGEYIQQMVLNYNEINYDKCKINDKHNKDYESYCIECNINLCKECLKTREHIDHYKINLNEIKPQSNEIILLDKIINDIECKEGYQNLKNVYEIIYNSFNKYNNNYFYCINIHNVLINYIENNPNYKNNMTKEEYENLMKIKNKKDNIKLKLNYKQIIINLKKSIHDYEMDINLLNEKVCNYEKSLMKNKEERSQSSDSFEEIIIINRNTKSKSNKKNNIKNSLNLNTETDKLNNQNISKDNNKINNDKIIINNRTCSINSVNNNISKNNMNINTIKIEYCQKEINLIYLVKSKGEYDIFGKKFVENNKDNINLIIRGKKKKLVNKYKLKKGENKVTLIIKNKLTNMSDMFYKCNHLKDISGLKYLDVSGVEDFSSMFFGCSSLNNVTPIQNWNVSNGIYFSYMFSECSSLIDLTPLQGWNVSNCSNFSGMFSGCSSLKDITPLSYWNVSKGKDFRYMFNKCSQLLDIKFVQNWNVSNGVYFSYMFSECSPLIDFIPLQKWNFPEEKLKFIK